MKSLRWRTAALVVSAVLVVSGCSSGPSSKDTDAGRTTETLNFSAEVDPETGIVILPADRFLPTYKDSMLLMAAQTGVVAGCARENLDIAWTGWSLDELYPKDTEPYWREFGPWIMKDAEKYGFGSAGGVIDQDDLPAIVKNTEFSRTQIDKVGKECAGTPEAERFDSQIFYDTPWQEDINETRNTLLTDPRAKKLVSDLSTCYAKSGMEMDPEVPGYPLNYNDLATEENIRLAVAAVHCKDSLDFTKRLVDIWADLQRPILEKYSTELIAQRQLLDKTLKEAETFIAENKDLYQPVKN